MHKMNKVTLSVCLLAGLVWTGCKKSRAEQAIDNARSGANAEPRSFDIAVKRVVLADELAPNETWAKNNLGAKAGAGKTFACVDYDEKNTGAKAASTGAPKLIDATGKEFELSSDAAGATPTEWNYTVKPGALAPGDTRREIDCFAVPTTAANGALKLKFNDVGWRDLGPFEKTVDLPSGTKA